MVHELTGRVFGRLTVLSESERRHGKRLWVCRCDCGKETTVYETHLVRGNSRSCSGGKSGGCTYGLGKDTPGYSSYQSMLARCGNEKHMAYHRYGGRGIKVCDRWLKAFRFFYEDMGPRPDGLSLERIDNEGNYEPGNCRWATRKEQGNNKATNVWVDLNGEPVTLMQYAERKGINYTTLWFRHARNGRLDAGRPKA